MTPLYISMMCSEQKKIWKQSYQSNKLFQRWPVTSRGCLSKYPTRRSQHWGWPNRRIVSNSLQPNFKATVFRRLPAMVSMVTQKKASLAMEAVHSRIQCHNLGSGCPTVVCMVAEDTLCQPMATNHSDIHIICECSHAICHVHTRAKYRRKMLVLWLCMIPDVR